MAEEESSLFRSEKMSLTQLYIPLEIAPQTVAELGEVGQLQFNDLNSNLNAFQRTFVYEIKRFNEMERKIRFLLSQSAKSDITVTPSDPLAAYAHSRSQVEIDQLETTLAELETKILQMNSSYETLNRRFFELSELRHVLRETAVFFQEAESRVDTITGANYQEEASLLASAERESIDVTERTRSISLGFVAGVIPRPQIDEAISDPTTDVVVLKNVFVIFAHSKELINKIRKICESMGATVYPVDEHSEKRRENALEVISRIEDLRHVLDNTKAARHAELSRVASTLDQWSVVVKKEMSIYHSMNMFNYDVNRKALIAEGWCPTNSLVHVQHALRVVTERTGSTISPIMNEIETKREPPTYQRTNKFTQAFQDIVDAYGVAQYGEKLEKNKWGEIWDMFFGGRYIILLMGIFSIFTGLIYNDIFSQGMTIFTSRYKFNYQNSTGRWIGTPSSTYAFGIDPAWHGAENSLIFSNSYKMKMAIVLGVIHMSFGISLQVYNHIHFKRIMSIYTEFLPQILFFWSIFGYLIFMIVFKWLTPYPNTSTAPGLLNTLIYMFLSPGTVDMPLFPYQGVVQMVLLFIAFVSVPWMLLAKPLYMLKEFKNTVGAGYNRPESNAVAASDLIQANGEASQNDTSIALPASQDDDEHNEHGHGGKFDFSEVMIHQMIHTIEFTLSGISNTASYLRLWALSLAHAQLSEVLWSMVLVPAIKMANPIAIIIGFVFWFMLTVFILLLMEGMSAFLHALRLHWVEFQNKFYAGSGRQFVPFSFALLLADSEE
ncbi:hypothetical protein BASA60_010598 [Batrachochytrium salamandrivorans]|nr:hypothetical protein BASA60_010598 [Batrachochytrium salamandrivorans]